MTYGHRNDPAGQSGDPDGRSAAGEADRPERDGGGRADEHEHRLGPPDMVEAEGAGDLDEGEGWDPPLDTRPGSGDPVLAVRRRSNAQAIDDCRRLGLINPETDRVLDMTYGKGLWWKIVRPARFLGIDIETYPDASAPGPVIMCDATDLGGEETPLGWIPKFDGGGWDVVAVDPPYKLNGTDQGDGKRYGVHEYDSVAGRHGLAQRLMVEGHRQLAPGGRMLYKCMAQVNGGKIRWQNYDAYGWAAALGMTLIEELGVIAGRPQPERHRWRCLACGRDNTGPSHQCDWRKIAAWLADTGRPIEADIAWVDVEARPWMERYRSPQEHAYMRPSVLMIFRKGPA